MNIQEKAEQYARKKMGDGCLIVHSVYCNTNGEVAMQDYTAGYNEAKRWIPVGERYPVAIINTNDGGSRSDLILIRLKCGAVKIVFCFFYVENGEELQFFEGVNGESMYNVKEWREI